MLDAQPRGAKDEHITEWLNTFKGTFKGEFTVFKKHVRVVQELLKKHCSKAELVEAATRFGLDQKMAVRLNVRNLSSVIHAAQYQAA